MNDTLRKVLIVLMIMVGLIVTVGIATFIITHFPITCALIAAGAATFGLSWIIAEACGWIDF